VQAEQCAALCRPEQKPLASGFRLAYDSNREGIGMGGLIGKALEATGPIAKAIEQIDNLVAVITTEKFTEKDSEFYRKWLEVAMVAIQGLEGEYEEILLQAFRCNVLNPEERLALVDRINAYINGERLRVKLKEAIGHLNVGRDVLQEHAERLLIWPKTRLARVDSLREYESHVNRLESYYGSLGGWTGGSAVALNELRTLLSATSDHQIAFNALVAVFQNMRDKSNLMTSTQGAASIISSLRAAFR
jgi:hypothetical protein